MKIAELAELVNGKFSGDGNIEITKVADFAKAQTGEIAFLEKLENLSETNASCVIVPENSELPFPTIQVKNPKLAFAKIAEKLHPFNFQNGWRPQSSRGGPARRSR